MKRADFDALLFVDVEEHAAAEPAPPADGSRYDRRPWSRLRDTMLAKGATTVGELPEAKAADFNRSTKSADGSVLTAFKGLFGGG
jgi:hypothetical protein